MAGMSLTAKREAPQLGVAIASQLLVAPMKVLSSSVKFLKFQGGNERTLKMALLLPLF